MSLREPEVIAGARGPREERDALAKVHVAERTQVAGVIPAGEVWFQARYARLRIQLTAPQDERLPDGRYKRTNPLVAQFDGAMLRLNPKKKGKVGELDTKRVELLQEHPGFGTLFWDFQDVLNKKAESERAQALKVLADPAQKRLILDALKAEGVDFALPKAAEPKSRRSAESEQASA